MRKQLRFGAGVAEDALKRRRCIEMCRSEQKLLAVLLCADVADVAVVLAK